MFYIDENTDRAELLRIWDHNTADLVDAFVAAGVDPDDPATSTDAIRDVIVQWISDGDECAP